MDTPFVCADCGHSFCICGTLEELNSDEISVEWESQNVGLPW